MLSLPGSGSRRLIGGSVQVALSRKEVQELLVDGFFSHLFASRKSRQPGDRAFKNSACRMLLTLRSRAISRHSSPPIDLSKCQTKHKVRRKKLNWRKPVWRVAKQRIPSRPLRPSRLINLRPPKSITIRRGRMSCCSMAAFFDARPAAWAVARRGSACWFPAASGNWRPQLLANERGATWRWLAGRHITGWCAAESASALPPVWRGPISSVQKRPTKRHRPFASFLPARRTARKST